MAKLPNPKSKSPALVESAAVVLVVALVRHFSVGLSPVVQAEEHRILLRRDSISRKTCVSLSVIRWQPVSHLDMERSKRQRAAAAVNHHVQDPAESAPWDHPLELQRLLLGPLAREMTVTVSRPKGGAGGVERCRLRAEDVRRRGEPRARHRFVRVRPVEPEEDTFEAVMEHEEDEDLGPEPEPEEEIFGEEEVQDEQEGLAPLEAVHFLSQSMGDSDTCPPAKRPRRSSLFPDLEDEDPSAAVVGNGVGAEGDSLRGWRRGDPVGAFTDPETGSVRYRCRHRCGVTCASSKGRRKHEKNFCKMLKQGSDPDAILLDHRGDNFEAVVRLEGEEEEEEDLYEDYEELPSLPSGTLAKEVIGTPGEPFLDPESQKMRWPCRSVRLGLYDRVFFSFFIISLSSIFRFRIGCGKSSTTPKGRRVHEKFHCAVDGGGNHRRRGRRGGGYSDDEEVEQEDQEDYKVSRDPGGFPCR